MKICENKKNTDFCEKLWNQCEPQIRKLCLVKMADRPEEIDDIVSDTYLALCEAVNNGKEFSNPTAWLYSTANNLISKNFRKLRTYRQKYKTLSDTEYELSYNFDFLDSMISDTNIEQIKNEIESELNDAEKDLLKMIYTDNLKMKEIANLLNTSVSAIKQKRYRLVKKIKQMAKEKIINL